MKELIIKGVITVLVFMLAVFVYAVGRKLGFYRTDDE